MADGRGVGAARQHRRGRRLARPLAKAKTFVQALAVGAALLPWTADYPMVAVSLLWFAVVLTLVSGAQYLIDGRSAATTLGHRTAHA